MSQSAEEPPTPQDEVNLDSSGNEEEQESDESEAEPVESLVAGKQRRERAGNRYAQLLLLEQQKADEAQEDDDLALLFEENEEDVEFADPDAVEAISDEDDDSSSDEEEKGPTAADDDLEGEKQLEKEERVARRADKRKAEKALTRPAARRKRVKIDETARQTPSSPGNPVERPRKKSERVLWIPTDGEAPVRASSRTLAVQNKQRTLENMKVNESRRMRQMAVMEAAQRRRDAKKKPMTQAEKLAEAAQTERLNSKSLNKWEETEKDRLEKQRARLEALQNRQLKGPVIRWYSGPAEWLGDKLVHVGKAANVEVVTEKKPDDDAQMPVEGEQPGNRDDTTQTPQIVVDGAEDTGSKHEAMDAVVETPGASESQSTDQKSDNHPTDDTTDKSAVPVKHQSGETPGISDFIDGLHYYASLPPDTQKPDIAPEVPMSDPPVQETEHSPAEGAKHSPATNDSDSKNAEETLANEKNSPAPAPPTGALPYTTETETETAPRLPPPPSEQPTLSTRNLVTLLNFDPAALNSKDIQRRILFSWPAPPSHRSTFYSTTTLSGKKSLKASASAYNAAIPVPPVCAVTGLPAKFRDPLTGLPYVSMEAFKTLRKCAEGGEKGGVWSSLLQAWVGGGDTSRPTKGVPVGFVRGDGEERGVKAEGSA